jgi:hypothetical protein
MGTLDNDRAAIATFVVLILLEKRIGEKGKSGSRINASIPPHAGGRSPGERKDGAFHPSGA